MEWVAAFRLAHILGACVLIGTGSGIAFFMLMAHRSGDRHVIAHVAGIVVIADMLFTATAALVQPITGTLLALTLGWSLSESWLLASIGLYVFLGALWLPVVWIQAQMRNEARDFGLSPRYHRLYRIWFACGVPAFAAIVLLLWLMIARPVLW